MPRGHQPSSASSHHRSAPSGGLISTVRCSQEHRRDSPAQITAASGTAAKPPLGLLCRPLRTPDPSSSAHLCTSPFCFGPPPLHPKWALLILPVASSLFPFFNRRPPPPTLSYPSGCSHCPPAPPPPPRLLFTSSPAPPSVPPALLQLGRTSHTDTHTRPQKSIPMVSTTARRPHARHDIRPVKAV